jgi:hypothetical protein
VNDLIATHLTPASSGVDYAAFVNSAKDKLVRDLFSSSSPDILGIRLAALLLEFGSITSLLAAIAARCKDMPPATYFYQLRRALSTMDEMTPMQRAVIAEQLDLS